MESDLQCRFINCERIRPMFDDFETFLRILAAPNHVEHQNAWRHFDDRASPYRRAIFGKIHQFSRNSFEADEIASKVMLKLINNDFRALKTFEANHNQKAFLVFLSTITGRTAMEGHGNETLHVALEEDRLESPPPEGNSNHEQAYVELIRVLRTVDTFSSRKPFKKELHTFIYALRRHASFRAKEVEEIPLVNESSHNVENILHQIEKRAAEHGRTLKKLQELRDLVGQ